MLSQVVQRAAVITLLEDELPRQLGAAWARLVLCPAFDQPPNATQPGVWNTLLMVGGRPVGSYWLGPRRSGLKYDANEQEQLLGLMQQAALALAYAETFDTLAQLNAELEERVATRTEHVLAQQRELASLEERQRLARDLHDSVKQTLFSLGLGLRSARNRVRSEPDEAVNLLRQQEDAALTAQVEMGRLLSQLRTQSTEHGDLVAILRRHCAMLAQQHGFHVTLETPPALTLPESLLSELTYVVKEALHNAFRHSGAAHVQLTLTHDDDVLTVCIIDQGCGFDTTAAPQQGHGLRGIRERVTNLGGRLEIQSAPGRGTTIWAQIILEEQARRQSSEL
jgi:signal transduction histidine kinase